jgi:hypothetical protein
LTKILKLVLIALFILVVYVAAILLGFNLPKPAFLDNGIEGKAELQVTLLMNNNVRNPLANIEVDVAEKPGPPPKGGVAATDENGIATFKIKPGDYYIYFNDNSFPGNLAVPAPKQVTVVEDKITTKQFLIETSGER